MKRCKFTHCMIYDSCDQNRAQLLYCQYVETIKRIAKEPNIPKHEQKKIQEWTQNKIRERLRKSFPKQIQ